MGSSAVGLAVALGVLAVATVAGVWWRRRDGRLRAVTPVRQAIPIEEYPAELARLGVRPGTPVTLLQFSSAFCAPCRATRRVCGEISSSLPGVSHIEVDAESHLDEVRALDIWRTPTVLVVDRAGRVVHRATGAPSKAQVIATIAPMLPAAAA
jgi:thiol-disulfide isomerase/thioredoxin